MTALMVLLGFGLQGCATTRAMHFGRLPDAKPLVTLVVSEDQEVVERECRDVVAPGRVLGCQLSWPVVLPNGKEIRSVKIVRYTDSLPSPMAFEIDAHELCHTVAVLQGIDDPCHTGNNGFLRTALPRGSAFSATEPRP